MIALIYFILFLAFELYVIINSTFFMLLVTMVGGVLLGAFLFGDSKTKAVYETDNSTGDYNDNNVQENNIYKPVKYSEEDDAYDGFYNLRKEEYQQEYGNDFEDALDDAWEEHQKNRKI